MEWTQEKSIRLRLELKKGWRRYVRETTELVLTLPKHGSPLFPEKMIEQMHYIHIHHTARSNWCRFLESLGIRAADDFPQAQNLMGETDVLEADPSFHRVLIIPKKTAERILVIGM